MITHVHARNFKSLADVNVSITRPTVLVGRNGAGKSACVDALRFVRDAIRDGLDKAMTERQGIEAVRRWGRTKPFQIEIDVRLSRGERYGFSLTTSGGEPSVKHEYVEGTESDFSVDQGILSGPLNRLVGSSEPGRHDLFLRRAGLRTRVVLSDMAFYSFYPNTLRKPQSPGESRRLLDDGSNLASVLQKVSVARHQQIRAALQRVVPEVVDFSVERVGSWLAILLHHADPVGGADIRRDLALESDGTLRALGIVTALYVPNTKFGPGVITIEEPELGIHPGALAALWSLIEEASERLSVIVTTHSPDLISRVPVNLLRVVRMEDGITEVGPLARHQVEAVQQELFTTGDLLRVQELQPDDAHAAGAPDA